MYDEDDDGKCGGGSLKGKPLTSYFTLMYRACRLAIKCTTNIDIFPFLNHTIITYDTPKYIKPFELCIFHGCTCQQYGNCIEKEKWPNVIPSLFILANNVTGKVCVDYDDMLNIKSC